ncbi:nucleoporin NUP159-like isoform X2 [Anopheles stephensi]|uniref:nucleoporin NUP159-like isoform X2 n=1 Tax=Anopheles stephensi TaxID=30069 RepID=UPI001658740B|nr:nucleoporin NUP159-like isoform X2 [Anopheles stephensi]
MACWQQLLLLLFVALVAAEESSKVTNDGDDKPTSVEQLPVPAALHRQKRHEVEIHRVIKRRPKLPPPPRGRKPRPPRRPSSKPRGKYGPPNINYPPLSHYVPQSIDDPYSAGFEASFGDHHGTFGEPPAGYGSPIHPSPAFGSPPFAYGQTITSYEGSSYGKPSYEASPSFGKHSFQGSSSSSTSFGKPSFELSSFDGGFSKTNFGSGPSTFDSKVPSFLDSSNGFDSFPGSKHSHNIGGYSHSFSHSSNKQPSFADSTAINTYTTPSGKGNYYTDTSSSFGDIGTSKHQLPLEKYRKDPYKTPISSYEVPSNSKSNLFEPSGDFETTYKRSQHNGGGSSTHSTSHSSVGASEEEYIPNLPTRYDQEQFHTPTKTNPNKPPISTLQTISDADDHFTSFNSYYDGGSESQKIPVKSKQPAPFGQDSSDEQFPTASGGDKRIKSRRKKKPKLPSSTIAHNLDTDDLRDAFGSSSDFHQVAIDADEFLDFEPKKQIKHSKPAGVTFPRAEDAQPSNFVLLSSQNNGAKGREPVNQRSPPPATSISTSKSVEYDTKTLDLNNYFQANAANQQHHRPSKPIGLDDLNILSIQKSNSHSYYAGSSQGGSTGERPSSGGFLPTRRRDMQRYRSAVSSSLDYTMLDDDDEENYDDISDIGTRRSRGNRKKKDLSETTRSL